MKNTPASVTPLFPVAPSDPERVAAELAAVLPRAQLAPSFEYQLSYLAGPMYARIQPIFGGTHAPLYLLTERRRRSVWNAVLAAHHPVGNMEQFRTELLEAKSRTLLEQAYGHLPRGFLNILTKCGETAQDPDFYLFWHRYLSDHPEDLPVVASRGIFDARLTSNMQGLPPALARLPIVGRFHSREVRRLVDVLTWIHGRSPDPALWDSLAIRLMAGEKPLNILTKLTDTLTFPPPHIKGDNRFRHIGSVRDLKETARRFENCLGEPYSLQAALRGTHEYYEYRDGADLLAVSIATDGPFGFMIDDIRLKGNDHPELAQRERITNALAEFGIFWRRGVFETLQEWDYPRVDDDLYVPDP